ncbi:MAG: PepSY domain-containing protein [Mesorhizobium sp.]|nr:PepSY domain-containing protein [Mesorhizobium sp.]MBL8579773.1 PepSY domain-containing protein [Mesorhizobium sp.]
MRKAIYLAAVLASITAVSAARADDDHDDRPGTDWMTEQQIRDKATSLNLEVQRIDIDDGRYEVKARDNNGRMIEVDFNPVTGEEIRDDH